VKREKKGLGFLPFGAENAFHAQRRLMMYMHVMVENQGLMLNVFMHRGV
jgi:hypothetical protein